MPSLPYQIKPGDALDVAFWQGVFDDLQTRLASLEATAGDWDAALADKSTELAEGLLTDSVSPQIAQLQNEIQTLRDEINAAEDQLNALLSAGIVGTSVSVTVDGLNATNATAALAELKADADALAQTVAETQNAMPVVATLEDAEAGTGTGYLTASLGAAQIAALAGDVVKEVFTSSGTFTKLEDDFFYIMEAVGGGGGGAKTDGSTYNYGGGGGGGAHCDAFYFPADLPSSLPVFVGAGGSGTPNSPGYSGGAGGDSGIGDLNGTGQQKDGYFLIAPGGKGGSPRSGGNGGDGGQGGEDSSQREALGASGYSAGAGGGGRGAGSSVKGGGGGSAARGYPGGISLCAGNGGKGNNVSGQLAENGQVPGGGGGGADDSGTYGPGGSGARGEVTIYRFKRKKQGA